MKKKVRLALLTLAGFLAFFAARQARAGLCEPECWDSGFGHYCCTSSSCIDYCF